MSRQGTITKRERKNGKITYGFVIDIALPGAPRRQERKGGFATEREAIAALTEARFRIQNGDHVQRSRLLLGEWMSDWRDKLPYAGLRRSTVEQRRRAIKNQILGWPIADIPLQALDVGHFQDHYRALSERGSTTRGPLAPRTVELVHGILRSALNDAVDQRILRSNPVKRARPPRADSRQAWVVWTPDELGRFLAYAKRHDPEWFDLWWFFILTGARRAEVLGLRWQDVDWNRSLVRIAGSLQRGDNGEWVHEATKTKAGERVVAVDDEIIALFRQRKQRCDKEREEIGSYYHDGDFVFCGEAGFPLNANTVLGQFKRLCERAGVRVGRLHDLRHTHVSWLFESGVNPVTVSSRVGHSSSSFTMQQYAHLMPGADAAVASGVGKTLSDAMQAHLDSNPDREQEVDDDD